MCTQSLFAWLEKKVPDCRVDKKMADPSSILYGLDVWIMAQDVFLFPVLSTLF
jgi:hypothetical protein